MTSSSRTIAVVLVALLLLLAGGLSVTHRSQPNAPEQQQQEAVHLDNFPVTPPPPMTAHMQKVLDESKGFSALVSYTDKGFEPPDISIRRGQTIRFTNNSSRTMWVKSVGGEGGVYPADADSCGQSAFDTCVALPPNDIWEFTFSVAGSWSYKNGAHGEDTGVVRVQ